MAQAHAVYFSKDWERKPWGGTANENPGFKLGRVEMIHEYKGDIEGEGSVQFLFAYEKDGGGFVGLEKITGSIGGKSGSFVLQYTGSAANERLQQSMVVIPGSGTGELRGLKGQVTMECALHMDEYPFTLEYELED